MKLKKYLSSILVIAILLAGSFFISCNSDDDEEIEKKPTPATFAVTLSNIENGDVIISPPGPFKQGDRVNLQPVTSASYIFSSWNINPQMTISGPVNGIYSFTMPGRAVTVGATFVLRTEFPFPVNKGTHVNGDFTISPEGPQRSGTHIFLTPRPSTDDHKFDRWESLPASVNIQADPGTTGRYFFVMPTEPVTINAIFVIDEVPWIPTGTIQVTSPVAGATPAILLSSANITTGNFTGVLTQVGGRRATDGTFNRKSVYSYLYTLTPDTGNRFATGTNITVMDGSTEITDVLYTYNPGDTNATLRITFPRTIDRPQDPTAIDIAFGRGAFAVASGTSAMNTTATPGRPFEGTSYLLSDPYLVWQAGGDAVRHWVSVDLGSVQDINTVVVTWGAGAGNLWDGMVAAVIQVADGPPSPWDWDGDPDGYDEEHTSEYVWNAPGHFSDYGWKTVGTLRNLARGEIAIGVMEPNPGTATPYNLHRDTIPWANFIEIDSGTRGRYIRIKVDSPHQNPGNNTSLFGAWTQWQRISAMEVYSVPLTAMEPGEVNSPNLLRD
jgi:hypothetical protein